MALLVVKLDRQEIMNEPEIRITKENGKLKFEYYPDMDTVINTMLKEPEKIKAKVIETPLNYPKLIRRGSLKQKKQDNQEQLSFKEEEII